MRRLDSDRQFRAGSFSFEAISQMPFSEIKIDRSLVEGCGTVATNATQAHPAGVTRPQSAVSNTESAPTTAVPGQRYAYSVSAIDVSGNESARSAEIEDQWNTPTSQPNP